MRTIHQIRADLDLAQDAGDVAAILDLADELHSLGTPQSAILEATTRASACRLVGQHRDAIAGFMRATDLALEHHDERSAATALSGKASAHQALGEYVDALDSYERARLFLEHVNDQHATGKVLVNIGIVLYTIGSYPEALERIEQAMMIGEIRNDPAFIARCMTYVAIVHVATGSFDQALAWYERSLQIHREHGDTLRIAMCIGNIGQAHYMMGLFTEALDYFRSALSMWSDLHDQVEIARYTCNIGHALARLERYDDAMQYMRRAQAMTVDPPDLGISILSLQAEIERRTGEIDAAESTYWKALELATRHGLRAAEASIHEGLRDVAQIRNDLAMYIEHNSIATRITEEIRGKDAATRLALRAKEREMHAERQQRERERAILFSTLPRAVADRIIRGEDVSGDQFDNAAVLFMDIAGFTTHSSAMQPQETTALLADIFRQFDEICERHDVTKIKTIGDSYMAVAFPENDPCTRLANAAREMMSLSFTWPDQSPLLFRIGMHCGPVVAGVIGTQRLQYDVWGDTVNVASRMESTGEPGKIHVSEAFASQLTPDGVVLRGEIEVKGKGAMLTYWLA